MCERRRDDKIVDIEFINVRTYRSSEENKVKWYVKKLKKDGYSDIRIVPYDDTLEIYIPFPQGQTSFGKRNNK